MKSLSLFFYGLLTLSLLFSVGCKKKESGSGGDQQSTTVSARNVSDISNVQTRDGLVPNFSFKDANGQERTFDTFKGKVTFVNFWATWCGPCKMELPDIIALSKEYSDKEVSFIGISTDRGGNVVDDVRSFVQKSGIPYQIVISNDEVEEAYGNIHAIPTTFIIDANGKILQTFVGVRSKDVFAKAIDEALNVTS